MGNFNSLPRRVLRGFYQWLFGDPWSELAELYTEVMSLKCIVSEKIRYLNFLENEMRQSMNEMFSLNRRAGISWMMSYPTPVPGTYKKPIGPMQTPSGSGPVADKPKKNGRGPDKAPRKKRGAGLVKPFKEKEGKNVPW